MLIATKNSILMWSFFFFKNYLPDEMLKFSSLESVGMIRGPWIVEAKSSSRILPSSE